MLFDKLKRLSTNMKQRISMIMKIIFTMLTYVSSWNHRFEIIMNSLFSSKRILHRFKNINYAVRYLRVQYPIQHWINIRISLRLNHLELIATTNVMKNSWEFRSDFYRLLFYLFFLFQEESPLVYSLTDYRLKQKNSEKFDVPTANLANSITLNSTSSLSNDEHMQDNKRLTSKWLVIDEINVREKLQLFPFSK